MHEKGSPNSVHLIIALVALVSIAIAPALAGLELPADQQATVQDKMLMLPLSFIENQGQAPDDVKYYVDAAGHTLSFMPDRIVLRPQDVDEATSSGVTMQFSGTSGSPAIAGLDRLPGTVNYFTGSDSGQWQTGIPTFGSIQYKSLYPGIDLKYSGTESVLKREFIVSPGVNPDCIVISVDGISSLSITNDGSLRMETPAGTLIDEAPVAFQEIGGERVPVGAGYLLLDDDRYSFDVGIYDEQYPLVIDPTLLFSSCLGGSREDYGAMGAERDGRYTVAVDEAGYVYMTGGTKSLDFPVVNAINATKPDGVGTRWDVFVAKIDTVNYTKVYATYIGGGSADFGTGIRIDSSGAAYVTGYTTSTNFTLVNPINSTLNGTQDAFLFKINPAGTAIEFSTYLGGTGTETPLGLAVDSSGYVYISGSTFSTDFPQVPSPNPIQPAFGGMEDGFIMKIDPVNSTILYSTYLGGDAVDFARGIDVDASGCAYVTGKTQSTTFPVTAGAYQTATGGLSDTGVYADAFVTKIDPAGTSLVYSTYLGRTSMESGYAVAIDGDGNAYVTGQISVTAVDFPLVNPIQTSAPIPGTESFVTKFNPAGSDLVYSTYLGGNAGDYATCIAVDSHNNAYIGGYTDSVTFPVIHAIQPSRAGTGTLDAFITKVNPEGSAWVFSTYFGGTLNEYTNGIAVDSQGVVYIDGAARSGFPLKNQFQPYIGTGTYYDAFITKISTFVANFTANTTSGPYPLTVQFNDTSVDDPISWSWDFGDGNISTEQNPVHTYVTKGTYTVNLTATNAAGTDNATKTLTVTLPPPPSPGPLPLNRNVFIWAANDDGVKYDLDGAVYGTGNNNTYYGKFTNNASQGLNEVHITNDTSLPSGQVTSTITNNSDSNGTFYLTNTGSAGVTDDMILLLAVNGTLPDDFNVTIRSSGYNFTPNSTLDGLPDDYVHYDGVLEETFNATDFLYGPQTWKPSGGTALPYMNIYNGQNQSDGQTYQILFVDLYVGALKQDVVPGLVDNGSAKVEFTFHNLTSRAVFDVYGWRINSNNGQGIFWTNKVSGTGSNGYTVLYEPTILPVANFTTNVTTGRVPLAVHFNDTSTGNPTSWNWTFGDGDTSVGQNPTHTYAMPGTYMVNLTASNPGGSDDESKPAFITVLPQSLTGKIGVYRNGSWYMDSDDSGTWNAGDAMYGFGSIGWEKVIGDWDGDEDREIGVYQAGTWYLDENGDGGFTAGDAYYRFGAPGWQPLAGDWNGDRSDEIGVYRDGIWYLDVNGDGLFDSGDMGAVFGAANWTPVVGDWNGNGVAEIGVYRDGVWYLDMSGDGLFGDGDSVYFFGGAGWSPVVGNWDGDGATEVGVYNAGAWYLDTNGDGAFTADDLFCGFGAPGWTGVIGDWDSDGSHEIGVYQDSIWYVDLNGDGRYGLGDIRYRFGSPGWVPVVW